MNERSCDSTSLPVLGGVGVLDSDPSARCVVASHCVNLPFPEDIGCGASVCICICPLCILYSEVSVKALGPFLKSDRLFSYC